MARTSTSSHDAPATAAPVTKTPSGTSKRSLSALDPGHGYPHGHLGHLTADQEAALRAFKTLLAEQKQYNPGAPPDTPPSHDDALLLRFLRARRWVPADAAVQFRATEAWRAAVQIEALYDGIDVDGYEQSRMLYPQWTGRRDRRGIPVYVFEIGHLDAKRVADYEKSVAADLKKDKKHVGAAAGAAAGKDAKLIRLFALYENLTRFVQPLCSLLPDREHARTPITLSTNIVDVKGVSLRDFWNLKGHMQAASQLATAHYPETLDRIFIVGAPSFFSTVWGWIKRWFDPVTVSKIFILSPPEVLPTLSSFIDIENIPKQYGGKLEFKWGDRPNLDPVIKSTAQWEDGHTEFPPGPVYWVPIDGGKTMQCVARGSVGDKERNEKVCTIPVPFPEEGEDAATAAAPPAVEETAKADTTDALAPADGANGVAAAPELASPAVESFKDAPEEPLASPAALPQEEDASVAAEIQEGVQSLSVDDKTGESEAAAAPEKAEPVPNGKPVTSS